MGFFDMFDKIDDIVYKPVEAICDWTKEPLKKWEHKRNMETEAQNIEAAERENAAARVHEEAMAKIAADTAEREQNAQRIHEEAMAKLQQELTEKERESLIADFEARARIDADIRRWNAEIDQMIIQQEDERRDRLVECIKRYQIDLANAAQDIVNSIGLMSLELREKANQLVFEKTKDYRAFWIRPAKHGDRKSVV